MYVNDHLTKRSAEIAKKARMMRKNGKILRTWTTNCKIFIKENGEENDSVMDQKPGGPGEVPMTKLKLSTPQVLQST